VRAAHNVKGRLIEASKRFGKIEHIVCSVPSGDYLLSFEALRRKVVEVLRECGVLGGALIFHGFRYDLQKRWYWSPHFHVLGFIRGGYARCRHCKGGNCYGCDGFEGKVYKCYRGNGYIVKALGERKTIFGTAWYQLNHATLRVGLKRFHVVTWFGVTGYSNFKGEGAGIGVVPCPACGEEMVRSVHVGKRRIVKDLGDVGYKSVFADEEFDEDGEPNYVEIAGGRGVE